MDGAGELKHFEAEPLLKNEDDEKHIVASFESAQSPAIKDAGEREEPQKTPYAQAPIFAVPCFCHFFSQGLMLPILPLFAVEVLHASDALVGMLSSARELANWVTVVPVGALLLHFSVKDLLIASSIFNSTATVISAFTLTYGVLYSCRLAQGVAFSLQMIPVQAWVKQNVASQYQGRMLSLVGGTARISFLAGPVVGGLVAERIGYRAVFLFSAAFAALELPLVMLLMQRVIPSQAEAPGGDGANPSPEEVEMKSVVGDEDNEEIGGKDSTAKGEMPPGDTPEGSGFAQVVMRCWRGSRMLARLVAEAGQSIKQTSSENAQVLLTAGLFAWCLQFVRCARDLIVPMMALGIGLSTAEVGYMVAVSYTADFVMFPAAGYISDNYGRKAAGVPAITLMAIGLGALPYAMQRWSFAVACALVGIGNGLTSGLVMTLASDLAPSYNPVWEDMRELFPTVTTGVEDLGAESDLPYVQSLQAAVQKSPAPVGLAGCRVEVGLAEPCARRTGCAMEVGLAEPCARRTGCGHARAACPVGALRPRTGCVMELPWLCSVNYNSIGPAFVLRVLSQRRSAKRGLPMLALGAAAREVVENKVMTYGDMRPRQLIYFGVEVHWGLGPGAAGFLKMTQQCFRDRRCMEKDVGEEQEVDEDKEAALGTSTVREVDFAAQPRQGRADSVAGHKDLGPGTLGRLPMRMAGLEGLHHGSWSCGGRVATFLAEEEATNLMGARRRVARLLQGYACNLMGQGGVWRGFSRDGECEHRLDGGEVAHTPGGVGVDRHLWHSFTAQTEQSQRRSADILWQLSGSEDVEAHKLFSLILALGASAVPARNEEGEADEHLPPQLPEVEDIKKLSGYSRSQKYSFIDHKLQRVHFAVAKSACRLTSALHDDFAGHITYSPEPLPRRDGFGGRSGGEQNVSFNMATAWPMVDAHLGVQGGTAQFRGVEGLGGAQLKRRTMRHRPAKMD
ncbi:hypothetical protein CYMTET_12092 [Cymbomonas tetramitiformis]|uniref:Major facilitator superfamily (MFS) profile domain-containing protein n=1 Tax=Cymbomonas tetramitiformis TaxID=36881 RepID=A0AAE0LCE5_9CHLO|nr:hypothetical protein CYMTET_12092 [Cymbomonas tetramitiformis]